MLLFSIYFFIFAVQCSNLTNPSNGQVDTSNGTLIGDTATYSCNAGYTLIGVEERYCKFDGSWSDSAPQCLMRKYSRTSVAGTLMARLPRLLLLESLGKILSC